ncbi:sensor histidine kinase [Actinacidiphila sp. bgisy160]|uniref:sensor histidine kinase n=1 Tax=Actinacidiphila sp. bgisy160 TaxID=3413796 RepID=UPI003D703401
MSRRFPSSLVVRLLALSVLVSVCSIAATAWLAVRTTTRAIRQEQGQAISEDARIYEALLGRAATHTDWRGVQPLVDRLARETGHRVVLTTQDRRPIADSADAAGAGHRTPLPDRASATVDPLAVDAGVSRTRSDDRIDSRAAGPFRLTRAERTRLTALAQRRVTCLRSLGLPAAVTTAPGGRPHVDSPGYTGDRCADEVLDRPTRSESRALARLDALVDACLGRRGSGPVQLALDLTWRATATRDPVNEALVSSCLDSARREQLAPYVAPAALLFIGSPDNAAAASPFDLSAPNRLRMAGVVGSVLLLTVAVTTGLGLQLVRPLRALTAAAQRVKAGDVAARVQVTGRDEIGRLAEVFNEMSQQRARLERLRTEMVGDIAHELRTPLSNIRGWLEAADDGVVPADGALVGSLLEEALLLQHIVDDLQDLAASDAGALRLHKVPCDVGELLQQVATAHGGRADHAGVALSVDIADGIGSVVADPVRLRQAVANLVSNAVRHTPPGGAVTVTARREDDAVVIAVADTGGGIRPEELPRVFDRFWRAEKSRSRSTGGSGLGLAIVRNLAHAHGGTVTAESSYGEGALFTLRLPGEGQGREQASSRRGAPRSGGV